MKTKIKRLETLKQLISDKQLSNQAEILAEMAKEGFKVTQATLSRDLRTIRVVKTAKSDGSYAYILPDETLYRRVHDNDGAPVSPAGYYMLKFSGNLGVLRTRPGYAAGVAHELDKADIAGLLGTVAGYDTVLLALAEDANRDTILQNVSAIFGY